MVTALTVKEEHVDVSSLTTIVENCPDEDTNTLTHALVLLMMAGARQDGFWSGEIIPPSAEVRSWRLVQRFQTLARCIHWQNSQQRRSLLENEVGGISPLLKVGTLVSKTDESGVATAIVTDVRAGMEDAYFAWEEKIQTAQARYRGYRGVYFQPPPPGRPGQWATLLRFDTPEALNAWFCSEERLRLLKEAERFVTATRFRNVSSSFPGWVPLDTETGNPPPNWKTALLVLLGLYPVVMLEIKFLAPALVSLDHSLASFLSLVASVAATTFGTMPLFIKIFSWWLFPKQTSSTTANFSGTLLLILLFVAEILFFSWSQR